MPYRKEELERIYKKGYNAGKTSLIKDLKKAVKELIRQAEIRGRPVRRRRTRRG